MISAFSKLLVDDIEGNLQPIGGISATKNIKPLTIIVEKKPRSWQLFADNRYLGCNYLISDVTTEPDTALDVNVTEKPIKSYENKKNFSAGVGGKVALDIFKALPSIKAEATMAGGISITVKTGGLALKTIDEKAFERELRSRKIDLQQTLVEAVFKKKTRRRICVVTTVLESTSDTVIECSCDYSFNTSLSAEAGGKGGSVEGNANSANSGTITLEAGTVFACAWRFMDIDYATGRIKPHYDFKTIHIDKPVIMARKVPCSVPKRPVSDLECIHRVLEPLNELDREERKKFLAILTNLLDSPKDIEAVADLLTDEDLMDKETFESLLENKDVVLSLLSFLGYTFQGDGDPSNLLELTETVIAAMSEFEGNDLKNFKNCNDFQRKELLRIVRAIIDRKDFVELDPKFTEDIQKEPVENLIAFLDCNLSKERNLLSFTGDTTYMMECMYFILYCLVDNDN